MQGAPGHWGGRKEGGLSLLQAAGSSANCRLFCRENGMPPIFMPIEDVNILQLLLDYGADVDARFEAKSLMDHPDTSTQVREYIKEHLS